MGAVSIYRLMPRKLLDSLPFGERNFAKGRCSAESSNSKPSHFLSNARRTLAGRSSPVVRNTMPTLLSRIAWRSDGTVSIFLLQLSTSIPACPAKASHSTSGLPCQPLPTIECASNPTACRAAGTPVPMSSSQRRITPQFYLRTAAPFQHQRLLATSLVQ